MANKLIDQLNVEATFDFVEKNRSTLLLVWTGLNSAILPTALARKLK